VAHSIINTTDVPCETVRVEYLYAVCVSALSSSNEGMINYQVVLCVRVQWHGIGSVVDVEHRTNGNIVGLEWFHSLCIKLVLIEIGLIKYEYINRFIYSTNVILKRPGATEWTPEEETLAANCLHAEIGVA